MDEFHKSWVKEAGHTKEYVLHEYFIYIKTAKRAKIKDTKIFMGCMFGR